MRFFDLRFWIFALLNKARRQRIQAASLPVRVMPRRHPRHRRARGLSIVELLISLAITAMLLTATMVAIDASFRAYAAAAESATTQTSTRMIVHRLLTLIRTSTAHGPLVADPYSDPPVIVDSSNTVYSHYLKLIDSKGNLVRVEYREDSQELWLLITPYGSTTQSEQPLLGGVTACQFYAQRRTDDEGVLVLERGSIDMTVQPDADTTLEIESGGTPPIRVIASTMPRKLD